MVLRGLARSWAEPTVLTAASFMLSKQKIGARAFARATWKFLDAVILCEIHFPLKFLPSFDVLLLQAETCRKAFAANTMAKNNPRVAREIDKKMGETREETSVAFELLLNSFEI